MQRRAFAAAALAACAWPALAADPVTDLLAEGEQALQAGDATRALQAFERAASLRHDPVAEWGMVRSWMQSGEYRRALAFAAHAAEGHAELSEGAGLYAWLLYVGGQKAVARTVLANAMQRDPNNALVLATERRLKAPAGTPNALLLAGPTRQGPITDRRLPTDTRAAATGLLMPTGDKALVPAQALGGVTAMWIRDAAGHTVAAQLMDEVGTTGLVELVLDSSLRETRLPRSVAAREAFPGSAEMALEFAVELDTNVAPAWPQLQLGFVGRWQSEGRYELGIDLAGAGPHGGPVYDSTGQLIGVALRGDDGRAKLLCASALRSARPLAFAPASTSSTKATMPLDFVYEGGLAEAVQLLVLRH